MALPGVALHAADGTVVAAGGVVFISGIVTAVSGTGVNATQATNTTTIAAATVANTVIKAAPGRLFTILVNVAGTAQLSIFDNATTNSGTIIGTVPANAAAGSIFSGAGPAANGITVGGNALNPGVTISWS